MAATQPHPPGTIYNVGEAETLTVTERLDGWNVLPVQGGPAAHFVKDLDFAQDLVYDTSRIRRELGYLEQVPYKEGMRRTLGAEEGSAER